GWLASSYFASYMLAGVSAYFWLHRAHWPTTSIASYILLSLGLAISGLSQNYSLMQAGLFVSGLGAGILFALGVSIISLSQKTDRNFGLVLVTQQLVAAGLYFSLPALVIAPWGYGGLCFALAVILGVLVVFQRWVPVADRQAQIDHQSPAHPSLHIWICLAGLMIYFAALSGVWAFVERMGDGALLSSSEIANALAISMIGGVAGGLLAAVTGSKFGRVVPILLATVIFYWVFFLLNGSLELSIFTLAVMLLSAAWNFVLAYQMGMIANNDQSKRSTVLMPAAQALGAMCGPALAGTLITGNNYQALLIFSAIALSIAVLPFVIGTNSAQAA
ncbi:MAG: hypothetical protein V7711_14860, partial [Pseudomonadales bacterium]